MSQYCTVCSVDCGHFITAGMSAQYNGNCRNNTSPGDTLQPEPDNILFSVSVFSSQSNCFLLLCTAHCALTRAGEILLKITWSPACDSCYSCHDTGDTALSHNSDKGREGYLEINLKPELASANWVNIGHCKVSNDVRNVRHTRLAKYLSYHRSQSGGSWIRDPTNQTKSSLLIEILVIYIIYAVYCSHKCYC